MCKKFLVVGVLAVVAGGLFVFRTQQGSLVRVWWNQLARKADKKISPEDRVEQIKLEIKKIDQAVEDEVDALAELKVKYRADDKSVKAQRERLEDTRARMKTLVAAVKDDKSQVSLGSETVQAPDFADKLSRLTREYTNGKKRLEIDEQVLATRKEAIDTRARKIEAMKEARDQLKQDVAKLESEIELMRLKQVEGRSGDDQIVGRTQELLNRTRTAVEVENEKAELRGKAATQTGSNGGASANKVNKENAVKDALEALEEKPKAEVKEDGKKSE